MLRRTKIIATLGPSTDSLEKVHAIIEAGANIVRLNFAHCSAEEHKQRALWVREAAKSLGKFIAILGDLQGPIIRIGELTHPIQLQSNQTYTLNCSDQSFIGDDQRAWVNFADLNQNAKIGDVFFLDDGKVQLSVIDINNQDLICNVDQAGIVSTNNSINKFGGGLSANCITKLDEQNLLLANEIGCDYVSVSFVKHAEDIISARFLLEKIGSNAEIVAKIERAEAVQDSETLDDIILASDAVMIARGNLGIEIGHAELIGVQKHIIERARQLDRVVITATQMMESMIENPFPTRAEVFDVANAVLDGTDCVMLNAETAIGQFPIETLVAVNEACEGAERQKKATTSTHRIDREFTQIDEAIAMSVMYAANHLKGVKAIISLTESGSTPLWMSRISSGLPIYALSRRQATLNRVAIYRGVEAIEFDVTKVAPNQLNRFAVEELKQRNIVTDGDLVLISKGDHMGIHGGTNSIKIVSCGNIL
ncbi:pyruvate kinase [Marinicellulosiphila megalodicopiae]|uniref:pyruvate kinase n=1 Tax=Marinicellulosiphila megalodicopiae TaxID=2724896 RepID=UPI003BB0C604